MKFRKFGKALLMSALSVGAVLSVTSCVQSYTVGFLFITGTQTSGTTGQGIISGYKIDHNTGRLVAIHGLPVASGGANPERAVLISGSRFLYVLNKGSVTCASDDASCHPNANIVQFAVGGNGILAQQGTYFTQGLNPFRIIADATGGHLYVLDHDAPSSASCALALGSKVTSCGDITAFNIDGTTGRLSLIENAQVSSASGSPLPYFPVPANPIDMLLTSGYILTLSGTPTTGDSVFPYTYAGSSGQLTVGQNSSQPLNINQATALQIGNSSNVLVLDNEPITFTNSSGASVTAPSQIVPYSVGTGGALQSVSGGAIPGTASQSHPLFALVEASKGKWVYVANYGDTTNTTTGQSGIAGYFINTTTKELTEITGSPFGTDSGPRCLVEDPSNQFIYTANFNDSTVSGLSIDQNSGLLRKLSGNAAKSVTLPGPATFCLVDGRTS